MTIASVVNTVFNNYLDKQVESKMDKTNAAGNSIWDIFSGGDGSGSNIVNYAMKFIGCNEADGSADKFLGGSSSAATPWCAAFVNFVMKHTAKNSWFNKLVQNPWYCPSIDQAAESAKAKVKTASAKAGDVVLFDWDGDGVKDHVGLVATNKNGQITTIEGNSSNQVKKNSYSIGDSRLTICKMG